MRGLKECCLHHHRGHAGRIPRGMRGLKAVRPAIRAVRLSRIPRGMRGKYSTENGTRFRFPNAQRSGITFRMGCVG